MMESGRIHPKALEAHYGSAAPPKALHALYRDGLLTKSKNGSGDVYETPMVEVSDAHHYVSQILTGGV